MTETLDTRCACPVCGKVVVRRGDGRVRRHNSTSGTMACPGSRQVPVELETLQE